MDCFEQVHDAAVDAIAELDALCERYDVSYIHYSRVFDSIIGICDTERRTGCRTGRRCAESCSSAT